MLVTVFRSRLRGESTQEYEPVADHMSELAQTMPGYLSHKTFVADDGERVTIVEFADAEAHRAWAEHPAHRRAQQLGRERFYSRYQIQVCEVLRSSSFPIAEPKG